MGKIIEVPLRKATNTATLRDLVQQAIDTLDQYGGSLLQQDPFFGSVKSLAESRYRKNTYRLSVKVTRDIKKRLESLLGKEDPTRLFRRSNLDDEGTSRITRIVLRERTPGLVEGKPITNSAYMTSNSQRLKVIEGVDRLSSVPKIQRYVRKINSYNIRNRIPVFLEYTSEINNNPDSRPDTEMVELEFVHCIDVYCRPIHPTFHPHNDTVMVSSTGWLKYSDKSLDEFLEDCINRIEAEIAKGEDGVSQALLSIFNVTVDQLPLITRDRIVQWTHTPCNWTHSPYIPGIDYKGGSGWDKLMFVEGAIPHLPKLLQISKTLSRRGHYVQEAFDIIPAETA